MPLCIIDIFKIIYVYDHQGRGALCPNSFQILGYLFFGRLPVQQAGKGIPPGLFPVGMDLLLVLRVIQHNGVNPSLSLLPLNNTASAVHPPGAFVLSHNAELCLKDILSLTQLIP